MNLSPVPVQCTAPTSVRWVQSALNQVLGLRLPVTGIMNAATRSALRQFQARHGLTADGIAGPEIERALIEAKTRQPAQTGKPPGSRDFEYESFETEAFEALDMDAEAAAYLGEEEEFPANRLPPRARATVTQGALAKKTAFRYVKDFSGPAAECGDALKRAGKTRAGALTIINAQIGVAIAMLRKAATDLKSGSRSSGTKTLFHKMFRVRPEFVPTWLKPTDTIKDRGDVVATRCKRVADLLASGTLKFFCTINSQLPGLSERLERLCLFELGRRKQGAKNQ